MCNLDISDCIIIHDCPTIETHNSHSRRYVGTPPVPQGFLAGFHLVGFWTPCKPMDTLSYTRHVVGHVTPGRPMDS